MKIVNKIFKPTFKPFWSQVENVSQSETIYRIVNTTPDNYKANQKHLDSFNLDTTKPLQVLDFGSGMLRYSVGLAKMSSLWNIVAYDNQIMLDKGRKFYGNNLPENITLCSDWDDVREKKFDCIISMLVLQHISTIDLHHYLNDFSKMTSSLFVSGRRCNDDENDNVWDMVQSYFDLIKCIEGTSPSLEIGDKNAAHTASFKTKYAVKEIP